MRKLKLQVQLSVDGFIAGPRGEMDWMIWDWDEELKKFVDELTQPVDCILLGRKIADGFVSAWQSRMANPETNNWFAQKMVNTPKIVFSRTLEKSEWSNTTLSKGDLAKEITRLKKESGKDIIAYGGSGFVSDLIKHGLIDEYYLFINPVVIGEGMPIFRGVEKN